MGQDEKGSLNRTRHTGAQRLCVQPHIDNPISLPFHPTKPVPPCLSGLAVSLGATITVSVLQRHTGIRAPLSVK